MAADGNSEGWSIWEAIGGLRANVQRLIEGQQRTEERVDRGLKETNARIDRTFIAIIGIGGTMIGIGGTIIGLLIVLIVGS